MRKLKHIIVLLLALGWLSLSFVSVFQPFAPIGKLLSYPEGIFFRTLPSEEIAFARTGYTCDIALDSFGVPTIKGKRSADVAFGLGYMHARDRYFQMEMITRTVQGTMSEVLGALTVESDVFWKPLDCDERAIRDLESLKENHPAVYAYMMAYSDGIRFYLENESSSEKAFEYTLIDGSPRYWEDHYPLLLSFYMSKILAYDEYDLAWATNLSNLSKEEYEQFYHTSAKGYPFIHKGVFNTEHFPTMKAVQDSAMALAPFDAEEQEKSLSIGSNNWAVSAKKSASGNAMLCNDTHLDINLPNPWYQAHLICDDFHAQGFTIPCSPYVLTGNNEHIAWGITNCQWDEVDLFKLKVGSDSSKYIVDGKEMEMEERENHIIVKGADDHVFISAHSVFGPVKHFADGLYAEKWHALEFNSSSPAFEAIIKGKNWEDFRNGLKQYTFPPQNFIFADKSGNVGLISAGKLPARPVSHRGEMLDGSTSYEAKYVEFDNLPQTFSGDSGFISSGNQMQVQANYYINYSWVEPFRGERIQEYLSAKPQVSRDDLKKLHIDKVDNSYKRTIALFDSMALEGRQADWLKELNEWNGSMSPEMKTPVKFLVIYKSLDGYFEKHFKAKGVEWGPPYINILNTMQSDTIVMDGKGIATTEIKKAVLDSAEVLFDRFVTEETAYGDLSPFVMQHLLRIPGLQATVPAKGGNSNTVDVNGHGVHGASMRTVIELGDTPKIETIIAGGQSGRVNSPHYKNQVGMWKDGAYNTVQFAQPQGEAIISFTK